MALRFDEDDIYNRTVENVTMAGYDAGLQAMPASANPEKLYLAKFWEQGRTSGLIFKLTETLRELVTRCDGPEGVRVDGSNIQTMTASELLKRLDGPHG